MAYNINHAFLAEKVYDVSDENIGSVYKSPDGNSWELVLARSFSDGYQGALFKNQAGQYEFASRGTQIDLPSELHKDLLVADLQMGFKAIPDQVVSQRAFFSTAKEYVSDKGGDPGKIVLTGHSLGASLVNLLGVENPQNKVEGFNAYGVGNLVPKGDYSNITNHVMARDPVSVLPGSKMLGTTIKYNEPGNPSGDDSTSFLSHFMSRFLWDSTKNQTGIQVKIDVYSPFIRTPEYSAGIQGDPFASLPIGEQQQLNKYLNDLFPLTGEFEQQDVMCTKLQSQFKTALTVAIDPLVLDLDGDGVETTTLSKTLIGGVNFNLDAKGLAEKTGWVGKDDGLLVRDLDGDGQITSGRELFGNHALLQSGKEAAHGFEALKELDGNADGVVDAKDNAFGTLRVWKDADSDGVTDAGELLTLDAAGVKSLKVGYSNANTIDAQGNAHRQLGSFTTTAGATRAMNDVWFGVDTARTVDQDVVAVSANIAALPELAGMGNVRSLRQAMARDPSGQLENLVQQWASGTPSQRAETLDQLIYVWAGVQSVDPASRGAFMDARKLAALEAFLGSDFTRGMGNPDNQIIANPLKQAYALLSESVVERLYWQTDAVPLLGTLSLTWVPADADATPNSEAAEGHFSYQTMGLVKALHEEFSSKTIGYGVQDLLMFMSVLKKNGGDALLQAMAADAAAYDGLFITLIQSQGDSAALSLINIKIGTLDADTISAAAGNASVLLGMLGDDALYGGSKDDVLDGGAGNDRLNGGDGSDTLLGGEGTDTLNGGFGNDTYIFSKGDGVDTITDYDYSAGNVDTLMLGPGLTAAEAVVGRTGNSLTLSWGADSMVVKDYFYSSYYGNYYQIEAVRFADGTQWNAAEIAANLVQNGTTNADSIYGLSEFANRINGLAGNDNLSGGNKDDVIDGGAGNDTVNGNSGADTLIGGLGNDTLNGGYGNDTYVFNKGDGTDTINDRDYTAGNVDALILGSGLAAAETTIGRSGNDLTLNWGADSVKLANYFSGISYQIEALQFADETKWGINEMMAKLIQNGTTGADSITGVADFANTMNGLDGNDTLYGGEKDDVFDGGAGNDQLNGGVGNDTYVFNKGDGVDTINDKDYTAGNEDTLMLGAELTAADAVVVRNGNNLTLTWGADQVILGSYFYDKFNQVESIQFADGPNWDAEQIAQRQNGTAGADNFQGLSEFANRINGLDGADNLSGGNKDDVLDGGAGNDTINGNVGNDTLIGGAGNDQLNGGVGNDTYVFNKGDGVDTINDRDYTAGNVDALILGSGLAVAETTIGRSGNDLALNWGADSVRVANYFSGISYQIEAIQFADETKWGINEMMAKLVQNGTSGGDRITGLAEFANTMNGLEGDDTLYGGEKDDVFDGGAGNDQLNGGVGNDTYVFNKGDGVDTINDKDYTAGNVDTLMLGAELTAAESIVARNANHLTLTWGSDQVIFGNYFYDKARQIEALQFADGEKWGINELMAKLVQNGTSGTDYITGMSEFANRINGLDGADNLSGGNKDDVIDGGAGNDTINGSSGNDTLIGGAGNDQLNGGLGNDTYVFNKGDGVDTINDRDYTIGNADTLMLGGGLIAADTVLARSGSDLTLSWGADSVTIKNHFLNNAHQVEALQFTTGETNAQKIILADVLGGAESGGVTLKGSISDRAFFEPIAVIDQRQDYGMYAPL